MAKNKNAQFKLVLTQLITDIFDKNKNLEYDSAEEKISAGFINQGSKFSYQFATDTNGNYTNQWHGQSKDGKELPTATYFYSINKQNGSSVTGWVYINR